MTDTVAPPQTCRNCTAALAGPYCARCGQKDRPLDPTVRGLVGDAVTEGLDVDGKLLRSLRLLFTRPGFLTSEIAAGRRASYVSPFRLYLTFSVAAFAATAFAADRALVAAQGDVISIGMGMRLFLTEADGPEQRRALVELARELVALRTAWLPRVMFALVPVAALAVMAVTRRSRRHYPQHFYFTLHVLAAVFAGMTLLALVPPMRFRQTAAKWTVWDGSPEGAASIAILLALSAYTVLAFRRVYGGGWFVNAARAFTVALVYGVFVGVALSAMLLSVGGW